MNRDRRTSKSYNFKDLEKITQEEFDALEKRLKEVSFGLTKIEWINEHHTVILFYACSICFHNSDSIKAIDPHNEWDVRCEQHGGHDGGTYGTIRRKVHA